MLKKKIRQPIIVVLVTAMVFGVVPLGSQSIMLAESVDFYDSDTGVIGWAGNARPDTGMLSKARHANAEDASEPLMRSNAADEEMSLQEWEAIAADMDSASMSVSASVPVAGGYGSNGKFLAPIGDPEPGSVEIWDIDDLIRIGNNLSGKYHLTRDIDFRYEWVVKYGPHEWEPIGTLEAPFSGVLDGQGYRIIGLGTDGTNNTLNEPTVAGLFGYAKNATIKNLGMERVSIDNYRDGLTNYTCAGALIGSIESRSLNRISISNCYVDVRSSIRSKWPED